MMNTFFSKIRELNEENDTLLEITPKGHFSVAKTFDCGQCFRFDPVSDTKHEAEFSGVAYGRRISFAEESGKLYIYGATEDDFNNIWCRYLGLDTDYDKIDRDILSRSDAPALRDAVEYGKGIRILRQEPWEAVCSFIISQNNNIPRIKGCVEKISGTYGKETKYGLYTFPTPKMLSVATAQDISDCCHAGYRCEYIEKTVKKKNYV